MKNEIEFYGDQRHTTKNDRLKAIELEALQQADEIRQLHGGTSDPVIIDSLEQVARLIARIAKLTRAEFQEVRK